MTARFHGDRVVRTGFVVAVFGWGFGFYGPAIFLHAVEESTGWSVALISAAVTTHFLLGAFVVAALPGLYARFGLVRVTRAGAVLSALGVLGWAMAAAPWALFAASAVSGAGWAMTGSASIAAMVSPWFVRRRAVALSDAYNGASVGGILLSPLWVALIALAGFPAAAGVLGAAMVGVVWWAAGRTLGATPGALGVGPDGDAVAVPGEPAGRAGLSLGAGVEATGTTTAGMPPSVSERGTTERDDEARRSPWGEWRFVSFVLGSALGFTAQIGLLAHLFSLLAPALGDGAAGLALSGMTVFAVAGRWVVSRFAPGWLRRRTVSAGNWLFQAVGMALFLLAGGEDVALLLAATAIFGVGVGNAVLMPALVAAEEYPAALAGRALALCTAICQGAYAFGPMLFGAVREAFTHSVPGGATVVFGLALAMEVAGAAILLAHRR